MWSRVRTNVLLCVVCAQMVACRVREPNPGAPRTMVMTAAAQPSVAPSNTPPEARPECPQGPIASFGYTFDELPLPDATVVKAIAVRGGRAWVLTNDTVMEHDGKRVIRETALCGGELKEASRGEGSLPVGPFAIAGYAYIAADDGGALAIGSNGPRMLVSRVASDGQLHCRDNPGVYPASPISDDGVWLARTKSGLELQDESGWRSVELALEPDAVTHGVAGRRRALVGSFRLRVPRAVYEFDGASWSPRWDLPRDFAYAWISADGVVLAFSLQRPVLHAGRADGGQECELVARIAGHSVAFAALPTELHPTAIVGRHETDLWFTGRSNVFHWDGTTWRQASPPLRAAHGVVDEDGAFWFVGPRSTTGWPHPALFRVRRK